MVLTQSLPRAATLFLLILGCITAPGLAHSAAENPLIFPFAPGEKLHYAVLKAENGRDAVALFARHIDQVVLVILDMNMPGMSGGVVFEELRKLKPDVKVLLTSGYGLDGQIQELLASGACGFAQKPFSIAALTQKLSGILLK